MNKIQIKLDDLIVAYKYGTIVSLKREIECLEIDLTENGNTGFGEDTYWNTLKAKLYLSENFLKELENLKT